MVRFGLICGILFLGVAMIALSFCTLRYMDQATTPIQAVAFVMTAAGWFGFLACFGSYEGIGRVRLIYAISAIIVLIIGLITPEHRAGMQEYGPKYLLGLMIFVGPLGSGINLLLVAASASSRVPMNRDSDVRFSHETSRKIQ